MELRRTVPHSPDVSIAAADLCPCPEMALVMDRLRAEYSLAIIYESRDEAAEEDTWHNIE